jgi:hypothetical protein
MLRHSQTDIAQGRRRRFGALRQNCCDRAKFPQNFTPAELTIFSSGVNAATRLHLE